MGNRNEQQEEEQRRARVPAFGEWDEMKAAGVLPDYSLDFSKIRAVRMQRKEGGPLTTWSSTAAGGVEVGGETERRSSSAAGVVVDGRDRRRRRHRRHSSDGGADLRRPLRHDRAAAPKERSKLGYLFCCIAG
ncbi:hypothetical protein OsI_36641 [Oryza sativa Indica Group]|uniref:RIN4 pathogenic type III effector avirulence factor Avr cleavage site domain-containing protein n=2 Tax=Oryza TaxID=4527 RepID=A0A0E0RAN5_ORYRU|nr:hypothetical protein OsI_36641 [Oryza sativa Indica Group]